MVGPRLQNSQLLDHRLIKLDLRVLVDHDFGCVFPVVLLDVSGCSGAGALLALVIDGSRLHIVFLHDGLVLVPGEIRLRAGELGCSRVQLCDDLLQIRTAGRLGGLRLGVTWKQTHPSQEKQRNHLSCINHESPYRVLDAATPPRVSFSA